MKYNRYLIGFFGLLLFGGMVAVLFYGIRPRPVPLIDLSGFTDFQEFTRDALIKLDPYLKDQEVVLLGFQPESPNERDLALNLAHVLTQAPYSFRHVVADRYLDVPWDGIEKLDSKEDWQRLLGGIAAARQTHERLLIVLPSVYSSHVVAGNLVHQLEEASRQPLLSISVFQLLRQREAEKSAFLKCEVPDADKSGTGVLGCAILQIARVNYRKKINPEKWAGLMDQRGQLDFALFLADK